jgi:flavin reductase (DIM6/NTAB) family NADH-FMN oxidoreductase RutF
MSGFDPARFRELCGRFVTGVTVATALDSSGLPVGMTVNSFTSVSLAPPLVSMSIDHGAELYSLLTTTPRFALNVLQHDQEGLSRRFAEPHPDRFAEVRFEISPRGNPVLTGALAVIECEAHAQFRAGDHTIVIGHVVGGEAHPGRPLLYYRGGYHNTELG